MKNTKQQKLKGKNISKYGKIRVTILLRNGTTYQGEVKKGADRFKFKDGLYIIEPKGMYLSGKGEVSCIYHEGNPRPIPKGKYKPDQYTSEDLENIFGDTMVEIIRKANGVDPNEHLIRMGTLIGIGLALAGIVFLYMTLQDVITAVDNLRDIMEYAFDLNYNPDHNPEGQDTQWGNSGTQNTGRVN